MIKFFLAQPKISYKIAIYGWTLTKGGKDEGSNKISFIYNRFSFGSVIVHFYKSGCSIDNRAGG